VTNKIDLRCGKVSLEELVTMTHASNSLLEMIAGRGWRGAIIPIGHLADLERAIRSRRTDRSLDETLCRDYLAFFSFAPPDDLRNAQSIIIVAMPVPQTRVVFRWKGGRYAATVPPTYAGYSGVTARVQAALAAWLQPSGYGAAPTRLPLKTLAVCSGLAAYGRNNICYVPGMGSFLQLVGSFSDLPCSADPWREPQALERCASCEACRRHCPSGAIAGDRFLLRAEYCLTYHNESANPFAAWIQPSWHHCLIGCMKCQDVCPENRCVREWFDDRVEFAEEETACFLDRVPFAELPPGAAQKLSSLEINEDYWILCRNLSALLSRTPAAV
jgi:epoxyqueuosine reductase